MSLMNINDGSEDGGNALVVNDLTAIEHVANFDNNDSISFVVNENNSIKSVNQIDDNTFVNVHNRNVTELTPAEWNVSESVTEMPMTSNTVNITISNGEIRPSVATVSHQTSTTRTIAPKPVTTGQTIAFGARQDNNLSKY